MSTIDSNLTPNRLNSPSHLSEDAPPETSYCKKACTGALKTAVVFAGAGLLVFAALGVSHALGYHIITSKAYSWLPNLAHNPTWYYYSAVTGLALGGGLILGGAYMFSRPLRKDLIPMEKFD